MYWSNGFTVLKRKIFIRLFVAAGLILTLFPGLALGDGHDPVAGQDNVGFQILKVPRPGTKPLVVAVWYPTNKKPAPMEYFLVGRELKADVAKDASPLKGPFPLVIISHGGGVSATSMAVYAEELAASGWEKVGACPALDAGMRGDSLLVFYPSPQSSPTRGEEVNRRTNVCRQD